MAHCTNSLHCGSRLTSSLEKAVRCSSLSSPKRPHPPVALWCWVVVLPGSVGLFASVLLVGVLCTPPPPLWPCGGPAVLAYMHACIHAYIHTYIHTCIRANVQTYTRTHTYIQTYIHTYRHTYIHTYRHTYIHTYIHTQPRLPPCGPVVALRCWHTCIHTCIPPLPCNVLPLAQNLGFRTIPFGGGGWRHATRDHI